MAYSFAQVDGNSADASGTSLAITLTVAAGNRIWVHVKWEGADTTVSVSDGATQFTAGTKVNHTNNDLNSQAFYLDNAGGGSTTVTVTWSAARPFRRMHVWEENAATDALDVQKTAQGSGTAISTGDFTTTGAENVTFAGHGEYAITTMSAPQVNGVAADNSHINDPADTWMATWRRRTTAPFTGPAAITSSASMDWTANAMSFREIASAIRADLREFPKHKVREAVLRGDIR